MIEKKYDMDNKKKEVIMAVDDLSRALNKYHGNSETAKYVSETLIELKKDESVAFLGTFQFFITKASILKRSEGVVLNNQESNLWHRVTSFRDLGYKLFSGMGLYW
ncbi:hypothetical protein ACFQAV_06135 [Companilactobacillus huachuanensis]|uniref:Bacteriocin immunity protein n=1 Tax=Companilactobacillus huachuanensis TaxID=2559914 RepID=A0ABW1RK32_9LACO|nr:hypothetical protein [Companilactobacillus huachuanensis]